MENRPERLQRHFIPVILNKGACSYEQMPFIESRTEDFHRICEVVFTALPLREAITHLQRVTDRGHRISKRSKPGADGVDVDLRDTSEHRFNILSQFLPCCYLTQRVRNGHFCRSLAVTCKFRLCLHPMIGASRPVVTPSLKGLARRYLLCLTLFIITD